MSGNSSCTRHLKIALEFAFKGDNETSVPVLFIICCQNFEAFPGFRLNNYAFTAYPYEEEILLSEGCPALILEIERDLVITSKHEIF